MYADKSAPRYFSFSKKAMRTLIIVLPTIAFLCIGITMTGLIYFKEIRHRAQRKEPAIIQDLRQEKQSLQLLIKELEQEKNILQTKVNLGVDLKSGPGFLSLFKTSSGREDKTTSPEMSLENAKVIREENKVKLYFKLTNLSNPVRRINGYIFVFMQAGNSITLWPANAYKDEGMQLTFSSGEYFGTSRFRPVQAHFPITSLSRVTFKIMVFNKFGDFIFKQIIARDI
jgi:uncharacterized FlaG/YvyC family protein